VEPFRRRERRFVYRRPLVETGSAGARSCTVRFVEVLFSDARRAERARELLCSSRAGDASQVLVIRDVSTYDHLASLDHSLAYPGAVLGAVGSGVRVGLVALIAALAFELELDTLYVVTALAFCYGALVGLLVGSQLPAPGPRAMRRGLAHGKAVVRVTTDDLASAMVAHDRLACVAGAERTLIAD
jgi:hypothetical protein